MNAMRSSHRIPPEQLQQKKPSQIKFIRAAQMSLFANISSWPPLGQVTFLKRNGNDISGDKARFTILLEASSSFPEQGWEVSIWHNVYGDWEELTLQKVTGQKVPVASGRKTGGDYHRHTFSGELGFPKEGKYASFTVKYRIGPDTEWQWVKELFGTKDGEIVFEPPQTWIDKYRDGHPTDQLNNFIETFNTELDVQRRASETPGAVLWSIAGKAPRATDGKSGRATLALGSPREFVRNFSLVRIWSPWLAPRHGMETYRLTEDAVLSSFLRKDGLSLVLLAVSGPANISTTLQSSESGVVISARNDEMKQVDVKVLAAVASSFRLAIAAVIYEARKLERLVAESLGKPTQTLTSDSFSKEPDDLSAQWLSSWYDGLAYCTWNSLGQSLTEEKILNALDTLKVNNINVVNLIIDDNWQSLDNKGKSQFQRGWTRFEANEEGFPKGLKHAINSVRAKHPNIKHIAVWHALMGYWGGISPNGELVRNYKTKVVKKVDRVAGGTMLAIDPDDIHRFYDDFYSFLLAAGVDSVKTDAQFFLDTLDNATDRARFTTAYQDAWSISLLRYFQARGISCMSQTPQIIFHSYLLTTKPRILLRNSDDFFPDIPSSHPWHIFCNAHNSLLTRHLNVIPDWDMFQTNHPYASFHGAARCISGGPIYITDEPGKHDFELINQMTALSIDGTSVILRPSVPGSTVDVYHNYNEGQLLKVGSYTGQARTGSGMLGLFNISCQDVSSLISILDFPGVNSGTETEYVVRAHSTGNVAIGPCDQSFLLSVGLEPRGWEILTAYPVHAFSLDRKCSGSELTRVAVLGLLDKMTGAAAIVGFDVDISHGGRLRFDITLKALGELGIYISDLGTRTVEDNFMVMISGRAVPVETIKVQGPNLLSVDILTAWREMRLERGWSNEVVVQVLMD
ncbi:raffinose synthase [Coccidioides immitis RMSCC 3703]|uniref:Raffinose synthase n=1 Tax=Coccidioides immitis RMSCC 3703 TaxID=454286 RepID=A0A0J8QLP7_COCIT|nr:raffinose synthase [Coccidioides immitis RMSCC 3703]